MDAVEKGMCLCRRAVWAAALACADGGGAAPLAAGWRETVDVAVAAGQTSNLAERVWLADGALDKTGAGTLALAASNLTFSGAGTLAVRGGTLAIAAGTETDAPAPCPEDVLARAALWLDAGVNVVAVESNGTAYADAWLDVREEDAEAPYAYPRAVAQWTKTNCSPEIVLNAGPDGTAPSIWFGRYASLRWMEWRKPDGTLADITGIRHVFAVHGVFQSYGYVFGCHSGNPDFHISDFSGGNPGAVLWHPQEYAISALRQGRTYLDGAWVDGMATRPKAGWQLLEVALGDSPCHANNFFNDRNIDFSGKRLGGDNLCEVAVFTNRLTETERLRVEVYLMRKWLGPRAVPPVVIAEVAAPGTLALDAAAGATFTNRVSGDGAVVKAGAGTAVLEAGAFARGVPRAAVLQAGTLDARLPVPLALAAGDRVTANDTLLTRAPDAGAGRIVKDGTNAATIAAVPADVTELAVQAGRLVLAAPRADTTTPAEVWGFIPNAGFEATQYTAAQVAFADGAAFNGWTAIDPYDDNPAANNAVFIFNRGQPGSLWPCDHPAPEGNQVLALKRDGAASTTMTLPVAGVYDLSFYTSGRNGAGYEGYECDICVVAGGATNPVATVRTTSAPYVRQSYRLPWLAAGDHTLLLRRGLRYQDRLATFDDFKLRLVSAAPPAGIPVANGNFELTAYPRSPAAFGTNNAAAGWSFSDFGDGRAWAGVTFAQSSARFYSPSSGEGAAMLGIVSNGAAWTTQTLPAGTYRLRGESCQWNCSINGKSLSGTQAVKAAVTRGDGTVADLGTLTLAGSIPAARLWPNAFAVTNGESVTLTLAGMTPTSGGLVDNLVWVPEGADIVRNGGFEQGAHWTFEYDRTVQPYASAAYMDIASSNHYGTAVYDGTRRLGLVQNGLAWQDIEIPAAGLYRLVLHAARRYDTVYGDNYGWNPVRAWLARGGATNAIGWTRVDNIPLARHEFLFRSDAAGTHRFGLQGMTDNSPAFPGNDRTALIDGVWIEPAAGIDGDAFALPRRLAVTVASGARLQLDFPGTQTVDRVRFAGAGVTGLVNQETCPQFVSGPGALYAHPKGTVLLAR
jgi:hypothetical protein